MDDVRDTEWQDEQETHVEQGGMAVELAVLGVIVSRLTKVRPDTSAAKARGWQVRDIARIGRILERAARLITKQSDAMIDAGVQWSEEWAKPMFDYVGKKPDDHYLAQIIANGRKTNADMIAGFCRTDALWLKTYDGRLVRIEDAYKSSVDAAILAFKRSEADYNTLIEKVVKNFSKDGARIVYKSGATRELYSAVAMNVRDGFRTTIQDLNAQQGEQFGADGVEVSFHGMCAPDHQPYQGKQFATKKYHGIEHRETIEEVQSRLKRPIGQGYNCRHTLTPILLGVSPRYSMTDVRKANARSNRLVPMTKPDGKKMTAYEFTQWQRSMETGIRKLKVEAALTEKSGQGRKAKELRGAVDRNLAKYRRLSKACGVETREERLNVYDWKL